MKKLPPVFGVLVLVLVFFPSEIAGEDHVTTVSIGNLSEVSTQDVKPGVVLSEDEIVLEKWRKAERRIKDGASALVKTLLRSVLGSSERSSLSPKCSKSFIKFISGLKTMKLWAFKMIDASGKIPNGFLNGYLSSLGDFDGCLAVDVPSPNPFLGQYCTVFMIPALPKRKPFTNRNHVLPLFVNFTKEGTLVDYMVRNAQNFYQTSARTSICVPSTCSIEEIRTIAQGIVTSEELSFNISIPTCDVTEPLVLSKSDVAIICVLSIIGFFAFIATISDVVLNITAKEKRTKLMETSTALKCLMCFSMYTNTLRLLKKDSSPDCIKIFHGMRVITLLWVILTHTYLYMNYNVAGKMTNVAVFGRQIAFQVIINGFFCVETFFFISAVLLSYLRMKFTGKSVGIPLYIFHRVWRLSPTMMLVIATSILTPHMGSGPGWKETVGPLAANCKANWWRNLLFINNFMKRKETCLDWLWYVAVDTHLYMLALLVIIPLKSRPKLALGLNGLLFVAGTVASAASHVYYKQTPTAIYVYSHPDDVDYFSENSYHRTYTHITTYCIGLYVGYLLATKPNLKIPKMLNIVGWLSSVILSLVVLYGVYDWNQGNVPGLAVSTVYMCTNKVVWALALGYVTVACYTGNGGIITSILSWSAFVPLSRLTYVAYLIHPIFHFLYVGSTRIPLQIEHKRYVYTYIVNVFISYAFAYLISLLFESPFMCLEKVMFARRAVSTDSLKPKPEENGHLGEMVKGTASPVFTIKIKRIENEGP